MPASALPAITKNKSEPSISFDLARTLSLLIKTLSLPSLPATAMQINTQTPAMMPSPWAKEAPPKFTGKYEDVKHLIKRYKSLCAIYNVDEDAERCECILDYCSYKVIHLIEALKSYTEKSWADLESDLLRYYDADWKETRYIICDLTQLTQDWKHRSIKTLTRWKSYEHKFITIGGWLFAKKKISDSELGTTMDVSYPDEHPRIT
jgi:hypothetical protein